MDLPYWKTISQVLNLLLKLRIHCSYQRFGVDGFTSKSLKIWPPNFDAKYRNLNIREHTFKKSNGWDYKTLKKLQSLHEANFSLHGNWTTSLENVPATEKQILPPFFPPFIPLKNSSAAARHIPSSATFSPSGSLPHFIYSQQFCFFETISIIPIYLEIQRVVNITSFEQTSRYIEIATWKSGLSKPVLSCHCGL